VERFYSLVPKDRALTIFFDDLKTDPKRVYEEVLGFLGVSSDNWMEFSVYNESKTIRSIWFSRLFKLTGTIRKSLGIKHFTGILTPLGRYNVLYVKRPPLLEDFRTELVEYFSEDVKKLSRLIGRDLSHWR
jgi:hypothetical protein